MKKFYCPMQDWDCPYWKDDNTCRIIDEGGDPGLECDDAYLWDIDEDDYDYMLGEK